MIDVTVEIEVVVERKRGSRRISEGCSSFEIGDIARSRLSQGQMTVFGPIIEVATDLLAVAVSNLFHGCAVRPKPVGDHRPRSDPYRFIVFFKNLSAACLSRVLVT